MRAENAIRDRLASEQIHDIGDMCIQVDIAAHKVRSVGQSCQSGGEGAIARRLQDVYHGTPAPTSMPSAVYQHECWFLWLVGRHEIGRASCRERVEILVGGVAWK